MSFITNEHPKNGRVTVDGVHLIITDSSTDDTVPISDCTNTEGVGWFQAGSEGGIRTITGEFTGIKISASAVPVTAGQTYDSVLIHQSGKGANTAYSGYFYVENVRRQAQVGQTGPATWSARGTFSGAVTVPTA